MAPSHLHKFGGSSLADADCYRRVAHILLTHGHPDDLVVVSAAGKTTNFLFELLALRNDGEFWREQLQALIGFQQELVEQLLSSHQARNLRECLSTDKAQIISLLSLEELTHYQSNKLISFGERWSARLLAALLRDLGVAASHVDACNLLVADDGIVPQVRKQESMAKVKQWIKSHPCERIVITGFICSDPNGHVLLLGRNGSDYSATLIASLANIERVTIWTDVEGVFNADPNRLPDAKLLATMSLDEADRLARLGSPVLHLRTLQPLFHSDVSLAVRSSYASQTNFTLITPKSHAASEPVITSLPQIVLFTLQTKENSEYLLERLALEELNPLAFWRRCVECLELAFTIELKNEVLETLEKLTREYGIRNIHTSDDFGLVALVSSGAQNYRRGFAKLLSRGTYPVYQDNFSLVSLVPTKKVNMLTHKIHRRCAGPKKRIGVILFGLGNIGETWLTLFERAVKGLNTELEARIELLGLVDSNKALFQNDGIDLSCWQQTFKNESSEWNYDALFPSFNALSCDELVALDISASANLAQKYPEFFARGIHLVSANKLAGSGSLAFYRELKQLLSYRRLYWRYNASCGAGLPVQHALNDLHNNGDQVESIGGIFSGTLCWLFEHYDGKQAFSDLVLKAKSLGITEPDPRDDLCGSDMQRKLLILAREIGFELELKDIKIKSPVPDDLLKVPLDVFLERIKELDAPIAKEFELAAAENKVLRYVASLELKAEIVKAEVGLKWVEKNDPYANLTPGDNVFVIRSAFYKDNPLIIRGPGAGREVTAAAVQSDLAHICRDLLQEQ